MSKWNVALAGEATLGLSHTFRTSVVFVEDRCKQSRERLVRGVMVAERRLKLPFTETALLLKGTLKCRTCSVVANRKATKVVRVL